jgi:hypothetical protein
MRRKKKMCPDPFNDIIMVIKFAILTAIGFPLIRSVVDGTPSPWLYITLVAYILILEYYYYFGEFHYVMCGIPGFYPSRYEQWKIEQSKTDEEKQKDEANRQRALGIFNDLKDKGLIDKDRELKFV